MEETKFVPSDTNTFPAVPAVAGIVAVDQDGKAAPPLLKNCPEVPTPSV